MTEHWQLWFPLIAILLVCLLFAWLALQVQQRRRPEGTHGLRLRDSLALGPRQRITLVDVAGQTLVLGVTPESINLLTQFPADDNRVTSSDTGAVQSAIPAWLQDYIQSPR